MTLKSVKHSRNAQKSDAISIRQPTALDKIIEKVPQPKGAVPNFGLPKWKHMPLESKIPMVPGPEGAYHFTRKKLGKKLWVQTKNAEFNLNDPCNHEMEYSYDSLHDEHLARYYSEKSNIQRLLKLGFISEELDVNCSLRDYNMYRKFLKKLHNDSINRELKRRQLLVDQKRVLEFANIAAQKEIERLNVEERKMLAREKAREELQRREDKRNQKRREKEEKQRQRLESLELAKEEQKQKRILVLKAKMESLRQKRAAAAELKQHQVIKTLIEWAKKESNRRIAREERLARENEIKRNAIEEKWKRRKEQEEIEMARKESILRYTEEERKKFIQSYTKKVESERANMQKHFKNFRRYTQCYMARRGKHGCCQKLQTKETHLTEK